MQKTSPPPRFCVMCVTKEKEKKIWRAAARAYITGRRCFTAKLHTDIRSCGLPICINATPLQHQTPVSGAQAHAHKHSFVRNFSFYPAASRVCPFMSNNSSLQLRCDIYALYESIATFPRTPETSAHTQPLLHSYSHRSSFVTQNEPVSY